MKNLTSEQKNRIVEFIQALAMDAKDYKFSLKKITIIKYLYLLDFYMAQETGSTCTGLEWKFVHYGPFSFEANIFIDEMVNKGLLTKSICPSKFSEEDFSLYEPSKTRNATRRTIWKKYPFYVMNKIFNQDLKNYQTDTYALLDFVYFETEPMKDALPGDILCFENILKPNFYKEVEMLTLSKSKQKRLKFLSRSISKRLKPLKENPIIYDEFFNNFNKADDDDLLNLNGTAEIKLC